MATFEKVRDLMPDSPISAGLSALAAALLVVEPELVYGLAIIVGLNAVASIWYACIAEDLTAGLVLYWLVIRIGVYAIVLVSIVALSHMADVDALRRLAFAGVAGWEVAVSLGLGARISPQFRPIYRRLVRAIDEHTPFDLGADDIDNHLDEYSDDR